MTGSPTASELLHLVADHWGVQASSAISFPGGRVNQHWRLQGSQGDYVLRRYSPLRLAESIPAEHEVITVASETGWPVARPIPATGDATTVTAGGATYALFTYLPGEPGPRDRAGQLRIKARLLARLHRDLDGALESQRPGFGRAWELDVTLQAAGANSFNSALAAFGERHPDLAAAVRRQRYRNLRELSRLGYGDLPSIVIHGDFTQANLLFDGPQLVGLLDFDEVRLDAALVDVAECVMQDCVGQSDRYSLDVRAASIFIEEYARTRPLSPDVLEMLPAMVRANMLRWVAIRLAQWQTGTNERAVRSIERSVNERFPALDEATPALQQLLTQAIR